jgi:hypothetical protein
MRERRSRSPSLQNKKLNSFEAPAGAFFIAQSVEQATPAAKAAVIWGMFIAELKRCANQNRTDTDW